MSLKQSNGEYRVIDWKCPACEAVQDDEVHPVEGPWFSCICGACGRDFVDEDLDEKSLAAWTAARAEAAEEHQ